MTTLKEFNSWLQQSEGCILEFKTAKNNFSADKDLPDYCAALSNEGGGKLILGVNPNKKVVGTSAFQGTHNRLSHELFTKIKIRVDVEEFYHPEGRVLIFHIPSRPQGRPIKSTGSYTYPMRAGESLTEMDEITLKSIFSETNPDFSNKIVNGLSLIDLDEKALENFKKRWAQKAEREDYLTFSNEKMLRAIGLLSDKGLNYACLILFGKKEKICELLPGSEIIFEWRQDAKKVSHDFRINWREPFLKIYDEVWEAINARNLRIPFQEGLFQREVYAFSEKPIREALLNAVAHRDYTINNQSTFIKASPEEFIIESPGGFPPGITLENILYKTYWRNRSIAETFEKAGLAERSGQGMDDIFGSTIKEGKGMPDLSESDDYSVRLKIPAQVKDTDFIFFLERVAHSKQIMLSFEEIYELEKIREQQVVSKLKYRDKFLDLGIIEKVGHTRGSKYILSHKYYVHEGKIGIHTRLTGLSRDQKKELILNHLRKNEKGIMKDFLDVFRDLKQRDINNLLQELKKAEKVVYVGTKRSGYWALKE
ncbi:MAG: putative DNA binding domain-containing protein [Candidatus Jettenia sp.]|nr:MAG: putative DNA binding domain-containing protein [Candidatus Jettenia sp.]